MRLTERDIRVIELVARSDAMTSSQIQIAEFGLEHDSRGQARRTKLVKDHWLDLWPGRARNEQAVYCLTRRASKGVRLLSERWGDQELARALTRIWNLEHVLGISEVRVRMMRACRELGLEVRFWLTSRDLEPVLPGEQLIPDGYAQTRRLVDGVWRTAAFFLELEHSPKSHGVIRDKLARYQDLIESGRYSERFAHEAMPRVLFVFSPLPAGSSKHRVRATGRVASELGATWVRATGLDTIKNCSPTSILTGPIWQAPASSDPIALFDVEPSDRW